MRCACTCASLGHSLILTFDITVQYPCCVPLWMKVFEGNADSDTVKHSYLEQPITARFLRFQTVHWNHHPSMRVEVVGCQRTSVLCSLYSWWNHGERCLRM